MRFTMASPSPELWGGLLAWSPQIMGDIGNQLILTLLLPFFPFLLFPELDGHLVDDGAQQGDFIVTLQFHAPSKALLLNLLNFLRQILHIPEWSRSCIMASTTASTTKLITRETQAAFRKYAVRRFWNEEDSFL